MYLFSDTLNAPLFPSPPPPHIPSAINDTVCYQTRHRKEGVCQDYEFSGRV